MGKLSKYDEDVLELVAKIKMGIENKTNGRLARGNLYVQTSRLSTWEEKIKRHQENLEYLRQTLLV